MAALADKPLLTFEGQASVNEGLLNTKFLYYHLQILLTRGCKSSTPDGRQSAENLLHSLELFLLRPTIRAQPSQLAVALPPVCGVPKSCRPRAHHQQVKKLLRAKRQSLHCMSLLPTFSNELGKQTRNPTVRRLENLAWRFYEHAKAVLCCEDMICTGLDAKALNDLQTASTLDVGDQSNAGDIQRPDDVSAANLFPKAAGNSNGFVSHMELELEDLFAWWTSETMIDGAFDWLGTDIADADESRPSTSICYHHLCGDQRFLQNLSTWNSSSTFSSILVRTQSQWTYYYLLKVRVRAGRATPFCERNIIIPKALIDEGSI